MGVENYDILITDIGFLVNRKPNPEWKIEELQNDEYHILAFAIEGESYYSLENKGYHIKKGDLLFFPRGIIHSGHSKKDNPWHFISVAFKTEFGNKSSKQNFNEMDNVFSDSNKFEYSALFTELDHMWTGKKPGYLIRCRSILLEILYLMVRDTNFKKCDIPHSHQIEKIINYMEKNYMNSYTIKELADMADISSSYFRSLFKKITGLTVIQYKNKIKIYKARDLLLSGECNVTEAAKAVGIDNIYYFSRLFKNITCVNPSDFIKR